ncbi:MAG: helix-turn-helix transcriptional regulator [Bacilli bacterium]|nr:helix-turn-helix transcriptional regulator [Bacilli bacterium]
MSEETLQEFLDRKPNYEEFHTYLFQLMKEHGLTDPDVYKKAGIDRKTWSKLISNDAQRPTKRHVAKIVIAMELPLQE